MSCKYKKMLIPPRPKNPYEKNERRIRTTWALLSIPPRPKNPYDNGFVKKCKICGKELSWRNEVCCSRSCAAKATNHYHHTYTIADFINKFIYDVNGCWNWIGSITKSGYGCFKKNHIKAHRFAYKIFIGKIPDGMEIHHKCENILCVRPDHLEALTPEEHFRVHALKQLV